jgi:hypothetical protein
MLDKCNSPLPSFLPSCLSPLLHKKWYFIKVIVSGHLKKQKRPGADGLC